MPHNIFDLTGKTVLVTGASSGLGRQACLALAKCGANIVGVARRQDLLTTLQQDIEVIGSKCTTYLCDLADYQKLATIFNTIIYDHRIDVLINAAGVADYTPVDEDDPKNKFEWIFQINATALWHVTKHVV
jgi:short-subunit dehydrogenase